MSEDQNIVEIDRDSAADTLYDHLSDEIDAIRHRVTGFTILGVLERLKHDINWEIDEADAED